MLHRVLRVGVRQLDLLDTRHDVRRVYILLLLGVAGELLVMQPPASGVVWAIAAGALAMVTWRPSGGMGCVGLLVIAGLYGCMLARSVLATCIALTVAIAAVAVSNHKFRQWRLLMRPEADQAWIIALGRRGARPASPAPPPTTSPPSPGSPASTPFGKMQPLQPPRPDLPVQWSGTRSVEDHLDYMTRFLDRPWTSGHTEILAQGILASISWLGAAQVPPERSRRMLDRMRMAIRRAKGSGPQITAAVQALSRLQMTLDEGLFDISADEREE